MIVTRYVTSSEPKLGLNKLSMLMFGAGMAGIGVAVGCSCVGAMVGIAVQVGVLVGTAVGSLVAVGVLVG